MCHDFISSFCSVYFSPSALASSYLFLIRATRLLSMSFLAKKKAPIPAGIIISLQE